MMQPSFCTGTIVHDRLQPSAHNFKYQMSWCLFDLDEMESIFQSSRFWSINAFNLVSIRNKDYIDGNSTCINLKIRKYLKAQTDDEFAGKIFLFTHPRFLGFGFNSVNFYFCYAPEGLKYIVSEINNTPWKEKHLYFHDLSSISYDENSDAFNGFTFSFSKEFHISPFVSMDMDYVWKFNVSDTAIKVIMNVKKHDATVLNVYLNTKLETIDKNLMSWTLRKPLQALKMKSGIYWQAMKLWIKKNPVYTHPKYLKTNNSIEDHKTE